MQVIGQIINKEQYRTDTPGAFFAKDAAQPFSTIFFSGGSYKNTAIVIAGVRGVGNIYKDKEATALRSDKQQVFSFNVATDNTNRWIACSYLDSDQAEMDRNTLLIMIDNYWMKPGK
jgi:hypothetical protein